MHPLVAGGEVASSSAHERMPLLPIVSYEADFCTDSIPVAGRADETDYEPVISVAALISENNGLAVIAIDGNVDETIVVQVAECGSAGGQRDLKCRSALC